MPLFLVESLDGNPDGKLAKTLTTDWKEKLWKAINDDINMDDSINNWLENPRWIRGGVYHSNIQKLKKKFDESSHYAPDIYLGLIKKPNEFMNDIDADPSLREESVIVRASLDERQEK